MGVGKGKVEVFNINHLFFCLSMNTPRWGNTAAAATQAFPLNVDSDSLPVSHATRKFCSLIPATTFLTLQELLTPVLFWCVTREAILGFGRGEAGPSERREGGPSERWEGSSTKAANAVLVFACVPGIILVACRDDPLHLRGDTRRPPSKCALLLLRMISCFSCTT